MGEQARAHVTEHYTWARGAELLEAVYRRGSVMRRLLLVTQRPLDYGGGASVRWQYLRDALPRHGWEVAEVSARAEPDGERGQHGSACRAAGRGAREGHERGRRRRRVPSTGDSGSSPRRSRRTHCGR